MKLSLLILIVYTLDICSQTNVVGSLVFNNNRFCLGIEKKINKKFSVNLDFGILGKDYFTPTRSILLYRIINSKKGFESPYYSQNSSNCGTLANDGYQIEIIGFKSSFNYYSDFIIDNRKHKFFRFNSCFGIFYGKAKLKPINSFIKSNPNSVNECSVNFELAGIYVGLGLSYFFEMKQSSKYGFGIGLSFPFYKPVTPYWYSESGITPLLSGVEPEIKLLITKIK